MSQALEQSARLRGLKVLEVDLHVAQGAQRQRTAELRAVERKARHAGVELVELGAQLTRRIGRTGVVVHRPEHAQACEGEAAQRRAGLGRA